MEVSAERSKKSKLMALFCEFPTAERVKTSLIAFNTVIERLLYLRAVMYIYILHVIIALSIRHYITLGNQYTPLLRDS